MVWFVIRVTAENRNNRKIKTTTNTINNEQTNEKKIGNWMNEIRVRLLPLLNVNCLEFVLLQQRKVCKKVFVRERSYTQQQYATTTELARDYKPKLWMR